VAPGEKTMLCTSVAPLKILTISGAGITNNSGITQKLATSGNGTKVSEIDFTNNATAGSGTVITNTGSTTITGGGGITHFVDTSSAENAVFMNGLTGSMDIAPSVSVGTSTFTTSGGTFGGFTGSIIFFSGNADHATFTIAGGLVAQAGGAVLQIDGGTAGS